MHPLDSVQLRRRGRSFMVGSTGSGKSTLACALIDQYHGRYPGDQVYFIDPKRRYQAVDMEEGHAKPRTLFPEGWREQRHGRRDSVAVLGDTLHKPGGPTEEQEGERTEGLIVQDEDVIKAQLAWLYDHASTAHPSLCFFDETAQQMQWTRADPRVRMLMQQGREIGVGMLVVHQTARWIDNTFLSESESFYIGTLYDLEDREKMWKRCQGTKLRKYLEEPLPLHRWLYVNRVQWDKSKLFDLVLD